MMRSMGWAALGTGFTFGMTALGAATVFLFVDAPHPKTHKSMLGFAAGVMTAASVWSLLLPSIERAEALSCRPVWLPAAAGLVLGVVFLAALDGVLPKLRQCTEEENWHQQALLASAITLHNIPEGMAVGLAFALAAKGDSFTAAAALALGIGIQNFPEGAAISLPLREKGCWRAFRSGMRSGIVEPVFGVLVVLAAGWAEGLMPWLLSFAAGAMIYVVVEELVPQAHSRAGTCGFVTGFLLMMVLDVALG